MAGETNLQVLLKTMKPFQHNGDYVFCLNTNNRNINADEIVMSFRELEGTTIIIKKELADALLLPYPFIAAWITLAVHSSLEAVGLTAAFSKALAEANISCNVVAAFYHDHIFVNRNDAAKAMDILELLSK
jgi:uncharacterized protein